MNGDGRADVITGPASGVGTVKIFAGGHDARGPALPVRSRFAGGVFVATGDITGDGRADIVASTSSGPGHLRVFNGLDGALVRDLPLPASSVSVAAADLNADGRAEIIGGIGPGGPPVVGILDGASGALLASFRADDATFSGGILVATHRQVHGYGILLRWRYTFFLAEAVPTT